MLKRKGEKPLKEVIKALLQTRGGGLAIGIIAKNYFSDRRSVAVLEGAAKLSAEIVLKKSIFA